MSDDGTEKMARLCDRLPQWQAGMAKDVRKLVREYRRLVTRVAELEKLNATLTDTCVRQSIALAGRAEQKPAD